LPAIFEMNFSDVNSQLAGNFSYTNHFVCPIQWWDSPWGFAGSTEGCLDGISFRLGKSNIIFAIFSIFFGFYLIFFKRKSEYALLFSYSLFMLSFSLFMMTEYSVFIWQSIPKIDFLQFPWRFLNYSGFSISLLIGFLIYFTSIKYKKFTYLMLTLIISSTLIFNLKLFSPQNYLTINDEFYTLEKNIKYNISSITSEYMPSGFRKPQNEDEIPATILQIKKGSGKVKIIQNKTGYILSEIKMNTTGTIHINKAYFPAWSLIIDSKQASLKKVSDGMEFVLPSGNHKVILQFIQTPIENFANILTFTGVIMVIIGIIRSKYKYVKKTS